MKSKLIIYPAILMLMVGIPTLRYYLSTPGENACVLDYVDNLEESNYRGYMYDIDGVKHLEAGNSRLVNSLEPYKIGISNGCIMASNNLFNDLNNTFYCTITYMIKHAPIPEKLKQPLEILKGE
ncbi:hypothetical protein A9Q91_01305 [Candidatus Gracilibacteria bacterium 28_42_T64]|nr:hypothetical protein A9Q91_01305 [Candidatus Gracilibacteria bacterium 28_42_T64]